MSNMSYIQRTLLEDEKVIYQATISLWSCVFSLFVALFSALAALGFILFEAALYGSLENIFSEKILSGFLEIMPSGNVSFGFFLLLITGIACSYIAIIYYTSELAITNKRVLSKLGLIYRTTHELRLDKIESVSVDQSIFGRIFSYGTLEVSGTGGNVTPISGIAHPIQFRRELAKVLDEM